MKKEIRNNKPKLNTKKAREVILYLLSKCGSMDGEKLGYLLYFVDFDNFESTGKSITGFTYIKK